MSTHFETIERVKRSILDVVNCREMSTESLNRTPETKVNETLMFNDGVLKQEHNLVVKP